MSSHHILALEDEIKVTYTRLQQTQSMVSEEKATVHIVNIRKAHMPSKLTDLKYDKVEKNQVPRIETIQQELIMS